MIEVGQIWEVDGRRWEIISIDEKHVTLKNKVGIINEVSHILFQASIADGYVTQDKHQLFQQILKEIYES